jgi:hypothetical protein
MACVALDDQWYSALCNARHFALMVRLHGVEHMLLCAWCCAQLTFAAGVCTVHGCVWSAVAVCGLIQGLGCSLRMPSMCTCWLGLSTGNMVLEHTIHAIGLSSLNVAASILLRAFPGVSFLSHSCSAVLLR